nr:tape measure protein [Actinomycetes bacterium]
MATELATAYISLSANAKPLANDMKSFFRTLDKQGGKAAKGLAQDFDQELSKGSTRGAERLGKKVNDTLSKSTKGSGRRAVEQFETEAQARSRRAGFLAGKAMGVGITAGVAVAIAGVTAAIAGIGSALQGGFERLKTIDQARFKLQALGHTAEGVAEIMASAEKAVKGTSFGLGDAATVAASAVAAGIKPGEELTEYLTLIADGAAVAGTSFDEMASIFNKVRTSNTAYTDDLRQLADRGIPIFTLLQKQFGVTAEELDKMVQDGKVSAADMERALRDKMGGAAKKMGASFSGAMSNAKAALDRVGAALLEPMFTEAAGGLGVVTTALDSLTAWVDDNQDTIIDFWAALGKAAVTAAEWTAVAAAGMLDGIAAMAAPIGDILGGVNKFQAWQADLRGDHETANELRAQAEEFFGWGEGLSEVADRLLSFAENSEGFRQGLDGWAESTKAAAAESDAAAESVGKLGESVVAARSDAENGIDIPVDVELDSANTAMQGFMAQWSKMVISPQAAPGGGLPGGLSGLPGVTGANSDGGGLLETASGLKQRYESMGFSNIGGYN